jgi:hypothetical protein
MTAPVNLLKRHVVKRKAYEGSGDPTVFECPLKNKKWYGIGDEERYDAPRIAGKIDIARRLRRLQRRVMHHVLIGENSMAAVQEKPVQAIFKSIGVDEPGNHTE